MPIYKFVRGGVMRAVSVDGSMLSFNGPTARRNLAGGEYQVQWFAAGNTGDAYTLKVGPDASAGTTKVDRKIGDKRKVSGHFTLTVA